MLFNYIRILLKVQVDLAKSDFSKELFTKFSSSFIIRETALLQDFKSQNVAK